MVLAIEASILALALAGWRELFARPNAVALLAVWGVAGVTLALLRPVRGQDVAHAERDPLVMVALLLLPYLIPFIAAAGSRVAFATLPTPIGHVVAWLGVTLAALGLALRIAAMWQLGARFSPLVALQREHRLETGGLYALVRHPGYLGSLLTSLGSALAFGSWSALPLWLLMVVAQLARVRREEALLSRHFGDAWGDYSRRTGALLPRLGAAPAP